MLKYDRTQFLLMKQMAKTIHRMTTSIKLDTKIKEEAQIDAIKQHMTFSEYMEEALKEKLKKVK